MKIRATGVLLLVLSGVSAAETNVETVLDSYMEAWNSHDTQGVSRLFAQDVSWYDLPSDKVVQGKGEVSKAIIEAFMGSVSDMYWVKSGDLFVSGNSVVYEWTYGGTFNGSWGNIPINNKTFSIHGVSTTTINDAGKIVFQKDYYDLASMMRELEVNP